MKFEIEKLFYQNDYEYNPIVVLYEDNPHLFLKEYHTHIISSDYNIIFMLEKLTFEDVILNLLPFLKLHKEKFVFIYSLYLLKSVKLIKFYDLPYIEKFLIEYSHILFNKNLIKKNIKKITNNELFMIYHNNIIDIFTHDELFKNLNKKKVPLKIQKKCFHYILKNYKNFLIHIINLHLINNDRKLLDIPFIHHFFFKNIDLIRDVHMKEQIILENQINNF